MTKEAAVAQFNPSICLDRLRKTMKDLSLDSQSPGRDLNPGTSWIGSRNVNHSDMTFGLNLKGMKWKTEITIFWVNLVSFAAITLCITYHEVFTVVCVKCDPWFYNGRLKDTKHLCKVLLQTSEIPSEMHEMLKTALSDNAMDRTQDFWWFSHLKHGETLVEDCQCSGRPSIGCTHKT
jgi:hypothetical protein